MQLAHKIRIFPNQAQEQALNKACGVARFAWNWALSRWDEKYKAKEQVSESSLRKELNAIKGTEFPWMLEVSKCAPQQAIINLGKAFDGFFKGLKGKHKGKPGKPKYKSKKNAKQSFYLDNVNERIKEGKFHLPHLKRGIRMAEQVRFQGKILSYTVSRDLDRWYVSVLVETSVSELPKTSKIVGVDLGIKTLATLSDGSVFENPKLLKIQEKRLARQARELAKAQKGSKNRVKKRLKLAKTHRKIRLTRRDVINQATTKLVNNYDTIVLEGLKVQNMLKNRKLSKAISDCGFGLFREMLDKKCKIYGKELIVADTFFPSSKTCSSCGVKKIDLKLSDRTFRCGGCGFEGCRDLNAAINLEKYGLAARNLKPAEIGLALVRQAPVYETGSKLTGCNC